MNWFYVGLGLSVVTAAYTSGWVAFRLYVRNQTLRELVANGYNDTLRLIRVAGNLLNRDPAFPTAEELAASLVPIWDTTSPYVAIEDVLDRGRESRYWPSKYREQGGFGEMEPVLFRVAQRMYEGDDYDTSAGAA